MPVVEFAQAEVAIQGKTIIHPLNLRFSEHRVGIIGANGSGKSTVARLINGLNIATAGRVTVDGVDLATHAKDVRKKVGFIFSDADSQIIMPTVAEDVAFSLRKHKLNKAEKARKVHEALQLVGLVGHEDQSPHMLSGGEKQLLALASISVLNPDLIVADEPTTLLDLGNRRRVEKLFTELPQQMIIVSHDLDLLRHADRIICMQDGRVVDDSGSPAGTHPDFSSTPAAVIERYVSQF
ncbi:energy-coupling factor ABC transporter ATP-binding protein [Corynebacterium suicordis]|uniref:ABC transporter ATP-binding protein n=1 Tax=Corynebacterium suicordis DSM 45110 TaxID=1121369 RepID=A0ABR9ZJ39_9CORY|nr:ABC transporter ATP-binding protein [Corynebacterium suicordis]MBF4553456.1 ABC transporter ATP-binding protein [Corynebacterium suicordis DSM 45110]MDR6277570.1 biotin transport system ATP-binding protein [Corynebacterium suicordis]